MSKNYFGLLDSRNTKYQGVIRDNLFNGIGILIDDQLTTVLSNWKKYSINGPSVIIFPTLQIFFGELQQGSPQGIVTYQFNQKEKLLIKFSKNQQTSSQIITQVVLICQNKQITYIQKDRDQYKIVDNFYSKKDDELLNILSQIFRTEIKKQQIDLNEYLKVKFVDEFDVFEMAGAKEIFFGFKGANSLGFKLQNNLPTSVGFWNLFPRNLIFGRKIYYNQTYPQKTKIQQGNFQEQSQFFSWTKQQGASIQCIKSVQQYFKKSTTFRNDFTKLDQIKKLFKKLKQIQEKVKIETSKRYGQTLLQNKYGSTQDRNQQIHPKQYTLQEVKQEIYKAVAKKHPSFKNTYRSPYESSFKKQTKYTYDDSNRSIRTFRQQNRVNQFDLNYQLRDYNERQPKKEDVYERSLTARNTKEILSYNKVDLLKNVHQILKMEKQSEQDLLNELIPKKQEFNGSNQKYLQRQNEEYISPITKRYRKYELKSGTNEKDDKRYVSKTSPFMVSPTSEQKKANPTRRTKYLQAEKENQPEIQPERYLNYTIGKERANRYDAINEQGNQSESWQSKSHSNLAKYKQRLKDSTPSKQATNKKANRYAYMNENKQQDEDDVRNSEKLMNELKLFDIQSQNNKERYPRSFTENNGYQYDQNRHKYTPYQDKQKLRVANEVSSSTYGMNKTYTYDPQHRKNHQKAQNLPSDQYKLTKIFSFQDRTLSDKANQNPQTIQSHKKLKRTYQYVD